MDMSSWALIIATLVGVFLTWIGSSVGAHFNNVKGGTDSAHSEIQDLKADFLKFQIYVANEYAKTEDVNKMETGIFTVLNRLEAKFDTLQKAIYNRGAV